MDGLNGDEMDGNKEVRYSFFFFVSSPPLESLGC